MTHISAAILRQFVCNDQHIFTFAALQDENLAETVISCDRCRCCLCRLPTSLPPSPRAHPPCRLPPPLPPTPPLQVRHNIVCSPLNLVHYALFWVPNYERHPTTLKATRLLALVNPDGDLHPDVHFLLPSGRVRGQRQRDGEGGGPH